MRFHVSGWKGKKTIEDRIPFFAQGRLQPRVSHLGRRVTIFHLLDEGKIPGGASQPLGVRRVCFCIGAAGEAALLAQGEVWAQDVEVSSHVVLEHGLDVAYEIPAL